jgi:hypothetical protein
MSSTTRIGAWSTSSSRRPITRSVRPPEWIIEPTGQSAAAPSAADGLRCFGFRLDGLGLWLELDRRVGHSRVLEVL